MTDWERFYRLAEAQHLVIAVRQAEGCGIGRRLLYRRAAREGWGRPHRGVLTLPGAPVTYLRTATEAYLAVRYGTAGGTRPDRDTVLVAGRSAASVHGFTERRPTPVQLVRPDGNATTERRGIVVARTATLRPEDHARVGELPVTAPLRTVRDMAVGGAGVPELAEIAARAVQGGRLDVAAIAQVAATLGPRPGRGTLDAVVEILGRDGRTDSCFEREIRSFVCGHGLVPHPGVYPLRVDGVTIAMLDVAYPPEQVFVESDGFGFHSLPSHLRSDHVRANEIVARTEWKPIRVGVQEFRDNPGRFLRQLRDALRSRGRSC